MQGSINWRSVWILLFALSIVCLPHLLLSQSSGAAQISGLITDQTSAVVPNAQVRAVQDNTGQVRSTVSSANGSYSLPNLPVGPYTLDITAPGFRHYIQKGIVLAVGEQVQLTISLKLGEVAQEVEVSAEANLVQTQETSISNLVDQQRIVA